MKLTVHDHYHATVIALRGRFMGSLHGEAYKAAIDTLNTEGKIRVVIDLAEAELMDSVAIGLLIASQTTLRSAGGDIRLANLTKRLRNLFLMTRLLGTIFESYDSLEIALQSYHDMPEPASTMGAAQ